MRAQSRNEIEVFTALEFVLEEREVLGEFGVVLFGEGARREDVADPVEVTHGPVRAFAIDEAASPHEFEDVVA
ncbi:MAG: hypothetical protein ACE5GJ_10215 [Gemmatimonadota bacterium]